MNEKIYARNKYSVIFFHFFYYMNSNIRSFNNSKTKNGIFKH